MYATKMAQRLVADIPDEDISVSVPEALWIASMGPDISKEGFARDSVRELIETKGPRLVLELMLEAMRNYRNADLEHADRSQFVRTD